MTSFEADLRHLNHIGEISRNDVAFIQMREITYKGSWKTSGGRSAWFNLKRKIDRLVNMLKLDNEILGHLVTQIRRHPIEPELTVTASAVKHVVAAEDIFLKIEEKPKGEDGTVLAEVRDLRRYLLLVEAEMVARGVVSIDTVSTVDFS